MSIRIMGIDPSSNYIGLTILNIDAKTFNIIDIITSVLDMSHITQTSNLMSLMHEKQIYLDIVFTGMLIDIAPDVVAIESPFINVRRPNAVIPLASMISVMTTRIKTVNPCILTRLYSPKAAKVVAGAKGNADKTDVLKALKKNTDLMSMLPGNIDSYTDHETDSIAIALCAIKDIREHPTILLM